MNPDPKSEPCTAAASVPTSGAGEAGASFRVLPHEWSFGAFLVITWARLVGGVGLANPNSLLFLGCILALVGVCVWAHRSPTGLRWRVRLLAFPAVMGVTFYALGSAVPLLTARRFDTSLLDWDNALLGTTPAINYQAWSQPWLNDLLMLGYLFFFVHLVVVPGIYCVRDLARFRQCIVGLLALYGVGFLSYTLFPAGGPHRWMTFDVPLSGLVVLPLTLDLVNAGSNGVDVFPSLHLAVSAYLLVFDWWHARARFWMVLVPCVLLWFSTVLLRFHYFVDLLGGAVLAILGLAVAAQHARRWGTVDQPQR